MAMEGYRGPQMVWWRLAALFPTAVNPTDITSRCCVLGACRHQSIATSWEGLENSPKQVEPWGHHGPGHIQGDSGSSLGHNTVFLPCLAPAL